MRFTTDPPSTRTLRRHDLLDSTLHELEEGHVSTGMHRLFRGLSALKRELPPTRWQRFTEEVIPHHPLLERVHEDPVCRHSFQRPRGYPGDAELIDYFYGLRRPDDASPLGRAIYGWCLGRGPVRGVRHRREWLASLLDEEAQRTHGMARVLSVACGHLREGALSGAFRSGWLDEFVALDSDPRSLTVAAQANPDIVTPVQLSVARVPNRAQRLGSFDLIYSAGLYDYLDEDLARRLTTALFGLLRPGGKLVLGNFMTDVDDSSFMEAFMGWELIYRSRESFEAVFDGIPPEQRTPLEFHADPYGVFGYLQCRRTS